MTAKSIEDREYNKEVGLLDSLFAFHPNTFRKLSKSELKALRDYYLTGAEDIPVDIFKYRSHLVISNPELVDRAHAALKKVCSLFDIGEIHY